MNKDIDKKAYLFYLYYFVIFFAVAIVNSFLSMYLANHGVSESAVGIINGIVQALALFVNPFFGRLTDRARIKNHVLYGGLILSIILLFILYYSTSVKMLVIMAISFMTVFFSLTIIYETITVDITSRAGVPYAPIRMSGTIGFSIMAAVCGFFLSDQEELLFPILIAVMSVSTLIAFLLPRSYNRNNTKEKKEETGNRNRVLTMLKDEEIRTVMIMFGAYWLTYAYNTSYFGVYMQKLGGDYLLVGIANMLNAVAEIPFHIGPGRRWMKRIGVRNALIVCTVTGIIRWTICAITRDPYILTFTMIMNGIMLVPTVIDVVEYLYAKAPEGYKTSVQTALRTPFMQGGQLLAYFGGGLLVGYFSAHGYNGIRITYAVSALVSVAVLIYVLISGEAAQKKKIQ